MKKILFGISFMLVVYMGYSQDSIKTKSKYIGISSAFFDNISSIDWGNDHKKIPEFGRKFDPGYSISFSYLLAYKKLLFEIALQYSEENDKFTGIPNTLYTGSLLSDSSVVFIEHFDYDHTMNIFYKQTAVSLLLKFNYQPLTTRKISLGFGVGLSPSIIASEKIMNPNTSKYEKFVKSHSKNDFGLKTIGSIDFFYFITKRISLKTSPFLSISLKRRDIGGYYIRGLNTGLTLGLYFTLN